MAAAEEKFRRRLDGVLDEVDGRLRLKMVVDSAPFVPAGRQEEGMDSPDGLVSAGGGMCVIDDY